VGQLTKRFLSGLETAAEDSSASSGDGTRSAFASDRRWSQWLEHLERDVRLWLVLVGALSGFRLCFILSFRAQIASTTPMIAALGASLNGLRYDMMVASYLVLPSMLLAVYATLTRRPSIAERFRYLSVWAAMTLVSLASAVFVGYFREYGEPFGPRIFGLVLDDTRAIGMTVWKSYQPVKSLAVVLAATWISSRLTLRLVSARTPLSECLAQKSRGGISRSLIVALLLIASIGAVRGSLGRRPAQLKDAAVTGDVFLDKAVLNPLTSLRYAISQELEMRSASGLSRFLADRDIRGAATRFLGASEGPDDLDGYLLRFAPGTTRPPRHIFLIVGEGLSAWPMFQVYAPLGLARGLRKLASEGIELPWFLPSSYGTIESLSVLMTGLAEAEVHTNYQERSRSPYPSSLAATFSTLGYRTRFFYGGYLSWQRIGDFARNQGFDEIYGGSAMGSWVRSNEWGVDDEFLFDFILSRLDDDLPSFNLIMTTSLHPPYDVDTQSKGFVPPPPEDLGAAPTRDLGFMGHYWYADQCITAFVRAAHARLPAALFAVTGDHPSRIGGGLSQNLLTSRTVPLILFGPEVLANARTPPDTRGSHMDIGPTLIELSAPARFAYHSLGSSLLDPQGHPLAIGQHTVMGASHILDLRYRPSIEPLPGTPTLAKQEEGEASARWQALHDAAHAVAWWRIVKGPALPPD